MAHYEWLLLVGSVWTHAKDISLHTRELAALLGTNGPLADLMTPQELAAHKALPDTLTVYRGCDKSAIWAPSWTTHELLAINFPFFPGYVADTRLLVTGTVKKAHILALKMIEVGATVSIPLVEIVSFSVKPTKLERLEDIGTIIERSPYDPALITPAYLSTCGWPN